MLRDYQHPAQIGLEPTPEMYVESLCECFKSASQRITEDGSLVVIIGDTYYGGGSSTEYGNNFKNFAQKSTLSGTHPGGSMRPIKPKKHQRYKVGEQIGIPWMVADGLRDVGFMIRQVAIWAKPNPMPGPFRRRLSSSHEYIIHATKSMKYYCDRGGYDDGSRIMRDVVTCSVSSGGHEHSAGFPKALIRPFIAALSAPGDMVLDPFAGSCVVGDVCASMGRDSTLCDINMTWPATEAADERGTP